MDEELGQYQIALTAKELEVLLTLLKFHRDDEPGEHYEEGAFNSLYNKAEKPIDLEA